MEENVIAGDRRERGNLISFLKETIVKSRKTRTERIEKWLKCSRKF
ncbi:hypothetical protein ES703_61967 [subsurface metagenome]